MIFTIGNPEVYDPLVAEGTCTKLGRKAVSEEFPEGYPGGVVYRTLEEAFTYRTKEHTGFDFDCAVYTLDASWAHGVFYCVEHPDDVTDELGLSEFSYHLLNDVKVLGKIEYKLGQSLAEINVPADELLIAIHLINDYQWDHRDELKDIPLMRDFYERNKERANWLVKSVYESDVGRGPEPLLKV